MSCAPTMNICTIACSYTQHQSVHTDIHLILEALCLAQCKAALPMTDCFEFASWTF